MIIFLIASVYVPYYDDVEDRGLPQESILAFHLVEQWVYLLAESRIDVLHAFVLPLS